MSADETSTSVPAHTIFLSYSRVDRPQAMTLVDILENEGFSVWWDGLLEGGERYAVKTQNALDAAKAVLVLWSENSIGSHWVHDEAAQGRDTSRLIPVSIDGSLPPLGFGQFQAIDVSGCLTQPDSAPIQNLLRALEAQHDLDVRPFVTESKKTSLNRRKLIIGAGATVPIIGLSVLGVRLPDILSRNDHIGVAVLPFRNQSDDPDQSYFSDGLTTEIRTRLSGSGALQVAGQTSSEIAAKNNSNPKETAASLGVTHLLTGSIQKSGQLVRIAVELSDGVSGFALWADRFERPLTDIFRVQTDIANSVALSLMSVISQNDSEEDIRNSVRDIGGTDSLEAFDAVLRANELYINPINEASDRLALTYYKNAIEIDPFYAAAHAGLSRILILIGNLYSAFGERVSLFDESVIAARKATEIAPDFAQGHSALGYAYAMAKLNFGLALAPTIKSYELAPGDPHVLDRYALLLTRLRQAERARPIIEKCIKLDPLSAATFRSSGNVYFGMGNYDRAIADFKEALRLNPNFNSIHALQGFAELMKGDDEAAETSFKAARSPVRRLPGLAMIARRRGQVEASKQMLDELVTAQGDKSHYQYAQIYADWGEHEKALDALETAWTLRDGGLVLMFHDPILTPLYKSPRYLAIARAMGFT